MAPHHPRRLLQKHSTWIIVFSFLTWFSIYLMVSSIQRMDKDDSRPLSWYERVTANLYITKAHVADESYESETAMSRPAVVDDTPDGLCGERLGDRYLDAFVDTATNYCSAESTDKLTCFYHRVHHLKDSFCIGVSATLLEHPQRKFGPDCAIRTLTWNETDAGVPEFEEFPRYWYETGAAETFWAHFSFGGRAVDRNATSNANGTQTLILVKREGEGADLWHVMMQIMSASMSLDILGRATDPDTGKPFWSKEISETAQPVILDDESPGPFYGLWAMLTGKPAIRLRDLPSTDLSRAKVVVPLAGSANPLWQGQWADMGCGRTSLLQTFSIRVLDFYHIPPAPPRSQNKEKQLTVTVVDRRKARHFLNQVEYVAELQSRHPQSKIQLIDFAGMNFSEQIKIARATDVLVGVHGAGLTHAFFLPPNSSVVEIVPPGIGLEGFNLTAQSLGHGYFRREGGELPPSGIVGDDWHETDVFLEKSQFLEVVELAMNSTVV